MGSVTNSVNIDSDDDARTSLVKSMWPGDIRQWASWHILIVRNYEIIDMNWCEENLGKFAVIDNKWWCFEHKNDCTLFKLRWLG